MSRGLALTKNEAGLWNRARVDAYLCIASIGMLAGVAVAYGRAPLQLPGHKVLFWMIPVLATRVLSQRRAGASVGALATVVTTLMLGGRLAGGDAGMPLVIIAGMLLDGAALKVEQTRARFWRATIIFAMAGASANLICFVKRLFTPAGSFLSAANVQDLVRAAASYAIFGLLAGLLGGLLGFVLAQRFRERPSGLTSASSSGAEPQGRRLISNFLPRRGRAAREPNNANLPDCIAPETDSV